MRSGCSSDEGAFLRVFLEGDGSPPTGSVRTDLSSSGFRYCPVKLFALAATVSGVPSTTILPPLTPPPGPRSMHPVGGLDDVEVVLDHDDGVAWSRPGGGALRAACGRPRNGGRWWARRGCRASCRWRGATAPSASFTRCASPPLERRRLLADLDVAEADFLQHAHLVADAGDRLEEFGRVLDRHVEHVGDRLRPLNFTSSVSRL